MKQTKPTKRELEAEKIAIEKQAKVMWNGMTSGDYDAYMQKVREERRLNWAENEDLVEEIKNYCDRKPHPKKPNGINTGLPVVLSALAGATVARVLIETGSLEPSLLASDINDLLGVTFAGFGAGGIMGLINAGFNCSKPITRAIFDRQVAKRQRKINANKRRNDAITYLEECLKKEEAASASEFTDEDYLTALANTTGKTLSKGAELEGQLELDLEDTYIGHA